MIDALLFVAACASGPAVLAAAVALRTRRLRARFGEAYEVIVARRGRLAGELELARSRRRFKAALRELGLGPRPPAGGPRPQGAPPAAWPW